MITVCFSLLLCILFVIYIIYMQNPTFIIWSKWMQWYGRKNNHIFLPSVSAAVRYMKHTAMYLLFGQSTFAVCHNPWPFFLEYVYRKRLRKLMCLLNTIPHYHLNITERKDTQDNAQKSFHNNSFWFVFILLSRATLLSDYSDVKF